MASAGSSCGLAAVKVYKNFELTERMYRFGCGSDPWDDNSMLPVEAKIATCASRGPLAGTGSSSAYPIGMQSRNRRELMTSASWPLPGHLADVMPIRP